MFRYNSKSLAYEKAKELNLEYGFSVFDGKIYVGTKEQLDRIGVIIERPIAALTKSEKE